MKGKRVYSRTVLCEGQKFFEKQLQQSLSKNDNKKFICFYYGPSANLLNFNQILISNQLLTSLGYDSQDICDDFLKFKHIFLEIFELSLFDQIITILGQNYESILANLSQIEQKKTQNSQESQPLQQNLSIEFQDYIYKTVEQGHSCFEHKLKAKFKFSKPNINTALIELQEIDETSVLSCVQIKANRYKQQLALKEQARIQQDLQFMKKLMHITFISESQNQRTTSHQRINSKNINQFH